MQYWKKVDLGDFETYRHEVLQYFCDNSIHFNHVNGFWHALESNFLQDFLQSIPLLDNGCKKFGPINEVAILVLSQSIRSTLHIDHTVGKNKNVKARINVPILNCERSVTSFFDLPKSIYDMSSVNKGGTRFWHDLVRTSIKPVTSVSLVEPTILRTSSPHTVFTEECKFPRISMTISFVDDVVKYLDEEKL